MKIRTRVRSWGKATWGVAGLLLGLATGALAGGTLQYDVELVPKFNIPKMSVPPKIDGTIDPAEWRESVQVMGMVWTSGLAFQDRPVAFRVAWDDRHLYLAYRSDILTGAVPHLKRASREKFTTGVVFDDSIEVGLFLHERNRLAGEVPSYLKFVINSLGAGEYMKNYPEIGQLLFNWAPDFDIKSRIFTDPSGKSWWEMELAMELKDLQMPVPHKAGDPVGIGLFTVLHNPEVFRWLDYPSASGHLEHYGFPRAVLTDAAPYVQVEELTGLNAGKLSLKSVVHNPAAQPLQVEAKVLDVVRTLDLPAHGSARFDVEKEVPDKGTLQFTVGSNVYSYTCNFTRTTNVVAQAEYKPALATRVNFNPANGRLALAADTLDAPIPADAKPAGATYRVSSGDKTIAEGKLRYFVNQWYDDVVELGELPPGKYRVAFALVDEAGKELVTAAGGFLKKDEAKEFSKWWNNRIGDPDKLLKPFEPLVVRGKTIACTRRVYELGSLGLPVQIQANGGPVLGAPAQIVVKVAGKEYRVPTDQAVKVTGQKDWRVDFECPPVTVGGVTFSAKGWMEQDGLVELALTYAPEKTPSPQPSPSRGEGVEGKKPSLSRGEGVASANASPLGGEAAPAGAGEGLFIEELRIEWPVAEDPLGSYMACMGQGNNYSARTIGKVPPLRQGSGQVGPGIVWNTRDDIGVTGSGRCVGNFLGNLWVGTEQRGLFWCADSDRGWKPEAQVAANALRRDGRSVVIVNNVIGSPTPVTEPRTIRFGYNASPFRQLAPGFRANQLAACGSFAGGKYKVNWDTKQDHFQILSPPFPDPARWPEYYAYCKEIVNKMMFAGINFKDDPAPGSSAYYNGNGRLTLFTANQTPLRGYGPKSIENPNPYDTFRGDWVSRRSQETLSKSYRDYMLWLMERQIKEGGCQHFYFDITMGETLFDDLAAGFGYRLPDGRIQPEAGDTNMREWYKRMWAMMQEHDLYPGGVSGHSTHSFSLKMAAFTDCILDSEFPMKDGIDVYTSDAMIALSCPHTFGVNVQHHGNFMNPTWPLMHDAAGGDYRGPILAYPEFKHWGMTRSDVEFIPYWRNQSVVKAVAPGLIASLWKRPPRPGSGQAGSVIIAVMNYGPDTNETTRTANLQLNLKALGIPSDALASPDRVRIRQFYNCKTHLYYLRSLKWAQELKGKPLPPIDPKLDPATGTITGFDINYHDVKFLAVDWDDKPINDSSWKELAGVEKVRTNALNWGINTATRLTDAPIQPDNPAITVEAWKRAGDANGRGNSILLRVTNTEKPVNAKDRAATAGTIKLDLKGLDVNVRKVWAEFTDAVALDGKPVERRESAEQKRGQGLAYNAYTGELYYTLKKGESRVFSIDRY